MKKRKWILVSVVGMMLAGCSDSHVAEEAVNRFYKENYTYLKTTTRADESFGEDGIYKMVTAGTVTWEPYEEYYKVIEATDEVLFDEVYCYEEGKKIHTRIGVGGQWVNQIQERSFPYGYGENLEFCYDRKEELDGDLFQVYKTKYKVPLSYACGDTGEKSVTAVVKQEYYIEEAEKTVRRIVTDLTDFNEKKAELNEEINPAGGKGSETFGGYGEKEILDILKTGEAAETEMPEE